MTCRNSIEILVTVAIFYTVCQFSNDFLPNTVKLSVSFKGMKHDGTMSVQ